MSNAAEILRALDDALTSNVELTLYGRAALQLGFSDPPEEYAWSRDVDAVLWIGQAEELLKTSNFWNAVERVNSRFAESGLYISHFFEENQVILLPDWRANRIRITGPWTELALFRLSDDDLFLTKLMRDDPVDIADAQFIADRSGLTSERIRTLCSRARVPDIPEIRDQFAICSKRFINRTC